MASNFAYLDRLKHRVKISFIDKILLTDSSLYSKMKSAKKHEDSLETGNFLYLGNSSFCENLPFIDIRGPFISV